MQISPRTGQTVEKIIRDANGRLVRATFYVYQSGTRLRARLISSEFVEQVKGIAAKVLTLPGFCPKTVFGNLAYFFSSIESPYFNSSLLYFVGSKPRAPTF